MGKSINNFWSVTTIGLDIAKNVFQVHAVDAKGAGVVASGAARGAAELLFLAAALLCGDA